MPLHKGARNTVDRKQKTFLCIKEEDLEIYGDFNSEQGQLIRILLLRCTGQTYCKSDKEINSFFKDKEFLMLSN